MKELGNSEAILYKIQTLIDGGARITLDLDASSSELIKNLISNKMQGKEMVYVAFVEQDDSLREL